MSIVEAALKKELRHPSLAEDVRETIVGLLKHGEPFEGACPTGSLLHNLPKDELALLERGHCYRNAYLLQAHAKGSLRYFEGYARFESRNVIVNHAWCVNVAGQVIDVTAEITYGPYAEPSNEPWTSIVREMPLLSGQILPVI
jgi:hypothetical protein